MLVPALNWRPHDVIEFELPATPRIATEDIAMRKPRRKSERNSRIPAFIRGKGRKTNRKQRSRLSRMEPLEPRQMLATDLAATAFTADGTSLSVTYEVSGEPATAFDLSIHQSSDGTTLGGGLGTTRITRAELLSVGSHTVSVPLSIVDPQTDYFLVAKADASGEVAETNEANNVVLFAGGVFRDGADLVQIHGDSGVDNVTIGGSTELSITLNSTTYIYGLSSVSGVRVRTHGGSDVLGLNAAPAKSIAAYGGAEGDSATINGSSSNETAAFTRESGTLTGPSGQYPISVSDVATIVVNSGGGTDAAVLTDTQGDDTFAVSSTSATLSGLGYSNTVNGFHDVTGYADAGGNDVAVFNDSSGNDAFRGYWNRASLSYGGGNYAEAYRFDSVTANAIAGGSDVALLYDSTGVDSFRGWQTYSRMEYAAANWHEVHGFDGVEAFSTAAADRAYLYDSPGDETLTAYPNRGTLAGAGFYNNAYNFRYLYAYAANGGTDAAVLYDSSGDDTLKAYPAVSVLQDATNAVFYNSASNFDSVAAYATSGGTDAATFFDSDGDDTFTGRPQNVRLERAGVYANIAYSFEFAAAYGTKGLDRANLYGSGGGDTVVDNAGGLVKLVNPNGNYQYASLFNSVKVNTSGGDTLIDVDPLADVTVRRNAANSTFNLTGGLAGTTSTVLNDNPALVAASISNNVVTLDYAADQSGKAHLVVKTVKDSDKRTYTDFTARVNEAPVLDDSGAMSLTAIGEDPTSDAGTLVSAILASAGGDRITDQDPGALEGIAVVATYVPYGAWEYSIDGGTTWADLGVPSLSAARLLAADAQTRIRFRPNANWYGTVSAGIRFRAWDRTNFGNGDEVTMTAAGGSTPFSLASETASITVTPINDPPVNAVPGAQATDDDTPKVFSTGQGNAISIADVDAWSNQVQVVLAATGGTITLAGVSRLTFSAGDGTADAAMSFVGAIVNVNAALDGLRFIPTPGYDGAASLQITTNDRGYTGSGGDLSDSDTVTILVTAVDSPPAVENDGLGGFSDARASGNVLANDRDPESQPLAVTAVNGQAGNLGQWIAGSMGGKFKLIADGSWVFDPDGDFDDLDPGDSQATSIAYTASDGGLTASATLTVNVVKYPAVGDDGAANYAEVGIGWETASGGELGSGYRYHAAGTSGATATWTYPNVPDGVYDIMVTWAEDDACSTAASFTIFDGQTEAGSASVDQTAAPAGVEIDGARWFSLGTFAVTSGQFSVQLGEASDGQVRADGIRFDLARPIAPLTLLQGTEASDVLEIDVSGGFSFFYWNATGTGTTEHPFTWTVEQNASDETSYRIHWEIPGSYFNTSGTSDWISTDGELSALLARLTAPVQPGALTVEDVQLDGRDAPGGLQGFAPGSPTTGFAGGGLSGGFRITGNFVIDWDQVSGTHYSGGMHFDVCSPRPLPCSCDGSAGGVQPSNGGVGLSANNDLELAASGCSPCGSSNPGTGISTNLFDRRYAGQFPSVQKFGTGSGWESAISESLMPFGDGGMAVVGGKCPIYFDQAGSGFTPARGSNEQLFYESSDNTYRLFESDGTIQVFAGFAAVNGIEPSGPAGTLLKIVSPSRHVTEITAFHDGMPETVIESFTEDDVTTTFTWHYDYEPVSGWQDLAQSLLLTKTVGEGDPEPLRRATYTYYSDPDPYGSLGDLKTVTLQYADGQGGWTGDEVSYYRYYESDSGAGFTRGLRRYLLPEAYRKLDAYMQQQYPGQGKTPLDASDTEIANFTCFYYEYDSSHRVTYASRFGNSEVFSYAYASAESDPDYAPGYNNWANKTTETRPDGTTYTVYTNFMGQTLLTDLASGGDHWYTYSVYDDAGRQLEEYTPAAVASYVDNGGAGGVDLVVTLNDNAGLVHSYTYYDDSLGTAAEGFLASESVREGALGTPVLLAEYQYAHHTDADGRTVHTLAKSLQYLSAEDTIDTSYSTTYFTGASAVQERVTTLPLVSADQNGSGMAATRTERFDTNGRVIWTKDERGVISHFEYDAATGAPTRSIADVDTSLVDDEPAGWTTAAGFGLHLVTDYEHDALGRIVQVLGPAHRANGQQVRTATWTIYRDADRERWTAQGYATEGVPNSGDWDTFTLVGPVSVTRFDADGRVLQEIQALAEDTSPGDAQTPPWATIAQETFTQTEYVSWTVHQYSKTKRVATAVYHDIQAASGDPDSDGFVGTAGTHYTVARFGYDGLGRQVCTLAPDGTATHEFFNAQGLLNTTWIGTDDVPTSDYDGSGAIDWKDFRWHIAHYAAAPTGTNMVLVSSYQYDGGADGGNGLLTESRAYFGSGASDYYGTEYAYDWRDRQTTVLSSADVVTHFDYDNLSRATSTTTYASADVTLNTGELRAQTRNLYDDLGQIYESRFYEVDPDDGIVGDYLPSYAWHDAAGNVIKTATANGLFQKTSYDGLGRVVVSYLSFDTDEAAYADADDVTGDTVIEQTRYWYDASSATIAAATYQRLPDDVTTTGELAPANSYATASVVWHDELGRTIATADFGREDVDSGLAHYFFDGTTGALIDTDDNGLPDVAQGVPPEPYTTGTPGSLAGLDFQLQLIQYDTAGRAYRTIDNLGRINQTDFDDAGRTIRTIQNYDDGTVDETDTDRDVTIEYQYDFAGRLVTMTVYNPKGLGNGVQEQSTKYLYASAVNASWQTAAVYPDSEDALSQDSTTKVWTITTDNGDRVTTTADRLGRTTTTTDQRGMVHQYSFDSAGRLSADTVTSLGSSGIVDGSVRRIGRSYDDVGRLETLTTYSDTAGTIAVNQIEYVYNGWGQLAREYQAHDGLVGANTPFVEYTYDDGASGGVAKYVRLSQVTYPSGRQVQYGYGATQAIDDIMCRLATIGDGTSTQASYTYLGAGRIIVEDYEDIDVKVSYLESSGNVTGLDRFGRVVDQVWTDYGADPDTVLDHFSYTHDRASNRTSRTNELNHDFDEDYTYDGLDRLTDADRADTFDQSWGLDGLGNFSTFDDDGDPQTRTANAVNEITAVTGGWIAPVYDRTGNMISGPKTGDETTRIHYLFDAWNHLVEVRADDSQNPGTPGDLIAEYRYDASNRRIEKVVAGASHVHYFYNQDWQLLEECFVDGEGATIASNQYVWSARYIDAPIVRFQDANGDGDLLDAGDNTRYYTGDANYNVTTVIDATGGDVVERYVFTAYGTATGYSPTWTNPTVAATDGPLYCGYFFDMETGLYQVRNRYYDSSLSLFVSRDPSEYLAGDPNLYRYCGDNAITYVDPTGLYGSDVHFYFNYYLAKYLCLDGKDSAFGHNGQTLSVAYTFAWMSQNVDMDPTTDPYAGTDSRRRFHFAGPASGVEEDDARVRAALDAVAARGDYMTFGVLLHVYEDTFSHQGYGPRTGHWTHEPDRPYRHKERDERMARAVFDRMYGLAKSMNVCCDLKKKSFEEFWTQVQNTLFTTGPWYRKGEEADFVAAWRGLLAGQGGEINFVESQGDDDPWVIRFRELAGRVEDWYGENYDHDRIWGN